MRQVSVEGLQGCRYIDTLQDWQELRQQEALVFDAETDRIYFDTAARLSIVDPGWGRRIHLDARGSRSAVLWNPWVDKAAAMPDFGDDEWHQMLCVEAANALNEPVVLRPGEVHCLKQRITLA